MQGLAIIGERLAAAVATLPLRACHHAGGAAPPEAGATISACDRLLLVVAGGCRMRLPQGEAAVELALRAGDALLVEAQAWNRPLAGDAAFVVLFAESEHLRLVHWRQARPRPPSRVGIVPGLPSALRLALAAARALGPGDDREASRRALCEAALHEALRHLRTGGEAAGPGRRLWQAVGGWLDEHLAEAIDRRAAARAFGVHPGHLSRVFRAHGEGFAATLIRRRLERAEHLLRSCDLPVAEVGRRCGYPDPAAFANAFRRRTGASPRRWRAEG